MNSFKIVTENTTSTKGGKFYTMLLQDGEDFVVEVASKSKSLGKKYASSQEQAGFLFDIVNQRLALYTNFADAEKAIEKCFSFKTLDKTMFVLMAEDRILTHKDIVFMKTKMKFRTRTKRNYKHKVKEENAVTIYIHSAFDKKSFGYLIGTEDSSEFKFILN